MEWDKLNEQIYNICLIPDLDMQIISNLRHGIFFNHTVFILPSLWANDFYLEFQYDERMN